MPSSKSKGGYTDNAESKEANGDGAGQCKSAGGIGWEDGRIRIFQKEDGRHAGNEHQYISYAGAKPGYADAGRDTAAEKDDAGA